MVECWKHNIPLMWKERKTSLPEGVDPKDLIKVPDNAQYFAALGAVEFGKTEDDGVGVYRGTAEPARGTSTSAGSRRRRRPAARASPTTRPSWRPSGSATGCRRFDRRGLPAGRGGRGLHRPGRRLHLHQGGAARQGPQRPDQESTSCRKGNPIVDTQEVLSRAARPGRRAGRHAEGARASAPPATRRTSSRTCCGADVALVETVAHTESALHFYPDTRRDLRRRRPGHQAHHPEERPGQGLQAQHAVLGRQRLLPAVAPPRASASTSSEYADIAFAAKTMPIFGYGCAVFMQSDIVDFQRQGWQPQEIMAGLADVLPKNIWLYVSPDPEPGQAGHALRAAGRHPAQPGGGQGPGRLHRVALRRQGRRGRRSSSTSTAASPARSAPRSRPCACGTTAGETDVHRHRGRAGHRLHAPPQRGAPAATSARTSACAPSSTSPSSGSTIDESEPASRRSRSKPRRRAAPDHRQLCEKGTVEDVDSMREIKKGMDTAKESYPNFVQIAAEAVWRSTEPAQRRRAAGQAAAHDGPEEPQRPPARSARRCASASRGCSTCTRVNPLFSAYFESLGVPPQNLVYSDFTTEELLQGRREARCHRPLLPVQGRHPARAQPAVPRPRQERRSTSSSSR